MWNHRSVLISAFLACTALATRGFADEVTPPGPPPEAIEEIGYAADILPGSAEFEVLPAAARALLLANPDAQAAVMHGRVAAFYGAPLARGATAAEAEQAFWTAHADAFGVANLDLTVTRSHDVGFGKFRVYSYHQRIDGLPVEYATGRVLVRLAADDSIAAANVVYATGQFNSGELAPLDGIILEPDGAIASVSAQPVFAQFDTFGTPEFVAFAGRPSEFGAAGFGPPVRAWRFMGQNSAAPLGEVATFFVDASSGELLHVRSEVYKQAVGGHVEAYVTPAPPNACWPDFQSRPSPVSVDLRDARVRITGAGNPFGFSDDFGDYSITINPPQSVSVSMGIGPTASEGGSWVYIDNAAGSEPSYTQTGVVPPATVDYTFNVGPHSPNSATTALMNVHQYVSTTHNFFASRTTWTGIDLQLNAVVNQSPLATAWASFSLNTLNFHFGFDDPNPAPPDESFPNSAYAPTIAHEYGHFIVQQLGLSGGAFTEGFGDCCSILQFEDPTHGRDWIRPNAHLRDYATGQPEKRFPCTDESHECGKVLAGFWWDILEEFQADSDPATDAELVRQLFVDWAQFTNGGTGDNAGHPLTTIEVRIADDNDGNLGNGTPHSTQICKAAVRHNLAKNINCVLPPYLPTRVVAFRTPQVHLSSQGGLNGIDPLGIAVADFDQDGANDVAISCEGSNNVLFYFGQSTGAQFALGATPVTVGLGGTSPGEIAVVPAGSGPPHLAVALTESHQVQIVRNNGSRSFTALTAMSSPVQNPVGIAVADWDQNGAMDIAVAGWQQVGMNTQAALGLLWQETNGSFTQAAYQVSGTAGSGRGFGMRKFSDSGNADRLAMTNSVDQIAPQPDLSYVFDYDHANPGNRTFLTPVSFVSVPGASIAAAPLSDDSLTDLAVPDLSSSFSLTLPQFRWAKQTPPFGLSTDLPDRIFFTSAVPEGIDAGLLSKSNTYPLQADPQHDVVMVMLASNPTERNAEYSIFVFISTGNQSDLYKTTVTFVATSNPFVPPYPRRVLLADVNNDGFVDVITANRGSLAGDDDEEGLSLLLNKIY